MIIDWQVGTYAHLQTYHGVGFVLNWPGTSTFVAYVAYNEEITGDVIFSEALSAAAVMIETQANDVVLTESISKGMVL